MNRICTILEIDQEGNRIQLDDGTTTSFMGVGHFHKLVKDGLVDIELTCSLAITLTGVYSVCDYNAECSKCPYYAGLARLLLLNQKQERKTDDCKGNSK